LKNQRKGKGIERERESVQVEKREGLSLSEAWSRKEKG